MKTYHGSCHCGNLRFEADIDFGRGTIKCNCSICTKLRFWGVAVEPSAFRLLSNHGLGEYRFLTQRDGHFFCKRCGIHTHATGESPRIGKFVAVVVACLDDVPPEELIAAQVRYLDGRDDIWDAPPLETRHL